jgi:hypothetical protein
MPEDNTQENVDTTTELDKALDAFVTETGNATQDNRGTTTEDQAQDQDTTQPRQQRGQQQPQQRGRTEQQDSDAGRQDAGGAPQRGAVQQTPRQFGTMFKSDQTGAIYDANGQRIADPGMGRRIFERVFNRYQSMETEHAALKQRLEAYTNADTAARDAGLSIEERAAGLRLMSAWKTDKLRTLNFLLTQASEAGIDVSSIRQGGGGLDLPTMKTTMQALIQEALAPFQPFVQNQQQERELQEARDAASSALSEFYEEFPDAPTHAGAIAAIMDAKGWDVRASYFALKAHAVQNGWDFSKPLQPQAQATMQNGTRRAAPTSGGNSRLPPMTGRAGGGSTVEAGSRAPANADASWDSIIGDVAKEHGIDLQ